MLNIEYEVNNQSKDTKIEIKEHPIYVIVVVFFAFRYSVGIKSAKSSFFTLMADKVVTLAISAKWTV